jgi:putative flippase GtrA
MKKDIWSHTGTRFIAVGITNTVIDFGILNLLVFVFGLNNLTANTISVTIAMAISYMLNYHVVFRQKSANHIKKALLFLAVTAFGLWVLQNGTIYIFVHWLTWPASVIKSLVDFVGLDNLSKDFVLLNTAKVIGTVISMLWNFFMYKKYVFTDNNKVDSKQYTANS